MSIFILEVKLIWHQYSSQVYQRSTSYWVGWVSRNPKRSAAVIKEPSWRGTLSFSLLKMTHAKGENTTCTRSCWSTHSLTVERNWHYTELEIFSSKLTIQVQDVALRWPLFSVILTAQCQSTSQSCAIERPTLKESGSSIALHSLSSLWEVSSRPPDGALWEVCPPLCGICMWQVWAIWGGWKLRRREGSKREVSVMWHQLKVMHDPSYHPVTDLLIFFNISITMLVAVLYWAQWVNCMEWIQTLHRYSTT